MKNKEIELSIIIPSYNVAPFISEAIESFLNQKTRYAYEIIIIDDGSTDNTLQIVEKYSIYSNITIYKQHNSGLGATRNRGITLAKGKYIYFCDSDDFVIGDFIENCINILNKNSLDILLFSGKPFFDDEYNGKDFFPIYNRKPSEVLTGKDYLFFAEKKKNYFVQACMYITRLDHIKCNKLFFPEKVIYEDNYFTAISILSAQKIQSIQDVYYMRRIRSFSIMTSAKNDMSLKSLNLILFKFEKHDEYRLFFSKCRILYHLYFEFLNLYLLADDNHKSKQKAFLRYHRFFLTKLNKKVFYITNVKFRIKYIFRKLGIIKFFY